jgi:mannose/fructose/N-acetylgalactosamine-specific phosphotransferase system component IIB
MTRIDARLIHGQVAVRWTKVTQAHKIVVIDNKTAKDEFLSEILLLAAPVGVKVVIYNEDQAVEEWKKDEFGTANTMIIFQNIDAAYRCYMAGIKYPFVNLGQSTKTPARTLRINSAAWATEQELDELKQLHDAGVEVYSRPTPEDPVVTFNDFYKRLKG